LGYAPVGDDPAASLHPIEGGVERAFLELQPVVGDLLEPGGDRESMPGTPRERLEDEEIEGAVEHVVCRRGHRGRSLRMSKSQAVYTHLDDLSKRGASRGPPDQCLAAMLVRGTNEPIRSATTLLIVGNANPPPSRGMISSVA